MNFTEILRARIAAEEEEERQKHKPPPYDFWHPSNMGRCDRKAVLNRFGVPGTPIDDRTARLFWMGKQVHKSLQEAASKYQPLTVLRVESAIKDYDYKVSGRADLLVDDGGPSAWELKSIHSRAFDYNDLPYTSHIVQLGVYLTFPPVDLDEDGNVIAEHPELLPSKGKLIYWSKNDARILEVPIVATEELRAVVKDELRRLQALYEKYQVTKELPPVLPLVIEKRPSGEPFYYMRGAKKGQAKKDFSYVCKKCEYLGNQCPLQAFGLKKWPNPKYEQKNIGQSIKDNGE